MASISRFSLYFPWMSQAMSQAMTYLVWYCLYTYISIHHQSSLSSTLFTLLWPLSLSPLLSCLISCPISPISLSSPCLLCCCKSFQSTVCLWDQYQLFLDHFDPFNYFLLWNQIVHFMNQLNLVFQDVKEYFLQTQYLVLCVLSAIGTTHIMCPHTLAWSW